MIAIPPIPIAAAVSGRAFERRQRKTPSTWRYLIHRYGSSRTATGLASS